MASDFVDSSQAAELTDRELSEVTAGYDYYHDKAGQKYYKWTGTTDEKNQKYFCPNCGRPVHWGTGWRFYCDPCNASWFIENRLSPNLASTYWVEISKREYDNYENSEEDFR